MKTIIAFALTLALSAPALAQEKPAIDTIDFEQVKVSDLLTKKDSKITELYAQANAITAAHQSMSSISEINEVIGKLSAITGEIHHLENQKAEMQTSVQKDLDEVPTKK